MRYTLLIASLLITGLLFSQSKRTISGYVVDAKTNEGLAFASIALKKKLIGTVTNEEGKFELFIPDDVESDTVLISFFGYKPRMMSLGSVAGQLYIKLENNVNALQEVVVRPMPPEHYIRLAMRKIKINYPVKPFETVAYYREKVLENKHLLKCDEGVFKTYYPNYTDTVANQTQLMLFRRAENTSEVEFMSKERKKQEEKEKKTGKKKENNVQMDLGNSFGGPETVLKSSNISQKSENFLDTTEFKNYRFSFAKSSTYNNSEVMVIDFSSRGKVDHVREDGKIYIDLNSMAVIRIESSGEIVIPVVLRPIIFMYGIGIENPTYTQNVEFQEIKGRWYPRNIQYNIDLKLTNRHWFKANEHSDFEIEQVFTVNKTDVDQPTAVAPAKRFKSDKDMKTQAYNDDNLSWEGLNIIKK